MYASIWTFDGNPDDLQRSYESLVEELGLDNFVFHACVKRDNGLLVLDTCPSHEAFDRFREADWFHELLERHGLPAPTITGHELVGAFAQQRRVDRPQHA